MRKDGKKLSVGGWSAIALGAVGTGVIVAFLAGYFLGHFTGHDKTTTIGAASAPANPGGEEIAEETSAETASSGEIKSAPAFSSEELAATPAENWISPPGGTTGARYSSLDEIDNTNISELKGDWLTNLNGSGTSNKYSQEASPVEYEGVIYISTGASDVFAVSAATGKILWEHKANVPASIANVVCCGWDNRGVAIGDGRVYQGVLDGYLVALNQKTGEEEWKTAVGSPREGFTVTMAPLYAGGLVFIGPVGADLGVRGFIAAYDAKTGKQVWKHWNVPGPGEPGHDSWGGSELWKQGGATTWNTPTLDPKLGLIYFSTGNAGEDFEGSERPGDNLYASSILALNMKTGKMAWYYQVTHHDIWDFDCPSPTVLIDGEMNGEEREAIAEPCKTGYVYLLDRKTGKPIYPIPEKPVPQNTADLTAKTQPIPSMPPFSPVNVNGEQTKLMQEAATLATPKGEEAPKVVPGQLFTPWEAANPNTIQSASNAGFGGENWPGSSFNPSNDYYYTCSQSSATVANLVNSRSEKHPFKVGEGFAGSNPILALIGADTTGYLTAYDLSTGKIAWQKTFPKESCYSGAVSTAGNVVLSGRNSGELVAYDATTGKQLWSFQTGAGANATPAVFEYEGKERVVMLAGGSSRFESAHGDSLWQFSLDGTKGPVPAGSSITGTKHKGEESAEEGGEEAASESPSMAGKAAFEENCTTCHGMSGEGTNQGPALAGLPRAKTVQGVVEQLTSPIGAMPSFKDQFSKTEMEAIGEYVTKELLKGK